MSHDIYFDPDTHVYLVDGQEVPSVTAILEPLHRSYSKVNPAVLEYAANRGRAVHEALEAYDLTGELEGYPEIEGYLRAYLEWQSIYRPVWIGVEQIVYHDYAGYIGTLDRIGYLNGTEFAVVDIKTSQATKEALVSACLQTEAYANAYADQHGVPYECNPARVDFKHPIKRYGLFLKADGTWRFQNCEEYEAKYNFNATDMFYDMLQMRKTIDRLLATKEKK